MGDPNKRIHVFGKPDHHLGTLVRQYGSEEAALNAVQEALRAAFNAGNIIPDGRGLFRQVIDVGGNRVTISGAVVNGEPRIGTAWAE